MKRIVVLSCLALAVVAAFAAWSTAETSAVQDNDTRIASLVTRLEGMSPDRINALEPLEVRRFEVPGASVDVMRARINETYTIDGVGEDTVELTGWIAVKHFNARTVDGSAELNWNNAVVDTQFVGMDLRGHSDLFGEVIVKLDTERPVQGQVGRIQIPEIAKTILLADKNAAREPKGRGNDDELPAAAGLRRDNDAPATPEVRMPAAAPKSEPAGGNGSSNINVTTSGNQPAFCGAPVLVAASMPELQLAMRLAKPAVWYSIVETIPPVGTTASVTVEPIELIADGRVVGSLVSGKVLFREVISRTELDENLPVDNDRVASN